MKLTSVFDNMEFIPQKYTCEGEDINPPLKINFLPESTKSLAIIVDDPDAPGGTFVHWLAWNITPREEIEENAKGDFTEGKNGFGRISYNGPCPPKGHGIHHYHFKVYALDTTLKLIRGASKGQLEREMKDHILSWVEIVGLYERR